MRTELLAADVEEIIREAQGEARAAVKARLRAQFEDALLEAVEARLGRDARAGRNDARAGRNDARASAAAGGRGAEEDVHEATTAASRAVLDDGRRAAGEAREAS